MGVVTVSSSASRNPVGLTARVSSNGSNSWRPLIVAFKSDKSDSTSLVSPSDSTHLQLSVKSSNKVKKGRPKKGDRVVSSVPKLDVDYNEAAAKLESIYKLSPPSDGEDDDVVVTRDRQRKRKSRDGAVKTSRVVVRNRVKKAKRLSLDKRVALKKNHVKQEECREEEERVVVGSLASKKRVRKDESEKIDELVRQYTGSTDLASLDWKKMKFPPVLPSSEHNWLFKLMQPTKALIQVKDDLHKTLGREPIDGELAQATNSTVVDVRRQLEVGRAARNKLIKHNLRLVLFVINKYFSDFASSPRFQDLCQAGVKGLITAIDRFEPKRKFRLSTYSLFWIRHAIIRSMTLSSFTRVSFGLESIRVEIQKTRLHLLVELQREPTEEEIVERVGISHERYHEVMKAAKPILSLHMRNATTQEELISGITDVDGGDNQRQPALLRLALDDVLDSLKPKESLVIRQRYGLDGKGDRTLGEIAANLNISREMVRKHEVKALMKLKHPARMDYLRPYVV
ncbi:unnamed protein product [Linum tenue]|uniref:Sigma factor n=1 Tax=Linum tenue TaxID=586396 RepID=A0AAV0QNB9_9ROSI|nr:unnamed protein product [Linum tenue]